MANYPDLFVLRHGETEWNVSGRFQGRMNSPLTTLGKAQAIKQKELLSGVKNLPKLAHVSPQERAAQTARIVLDPGARVLIDDRLQEIDFGAWEGVTREDIKSQITCTFDSGLWNFQSPGGEDFAAISKRVQGFLAALDAPAIVVTHGTTSIVLRGIWLGFGLEEMLNLSRAQGCIFHLTNGAETILQ